jgi:ABC-type transporter Mla MlaB component
VSADQIKEIDFGEKLSITHCAEIYPQLMQAMAEGRAVSLNVSRVDQVDTAAVQLLFSFQRDAVTRGLVTIWSKPSKVFCDAVDTLGMHAFYLQDA